MKDFEDGRWQVRRINSDILLMRCFEILERGGNWSLIYLFVEWGKNLATLQVRAHLHQVSPSTLQQLCGDTSDTVLIEIHGVTPDWVATHFQMAPLFLMRLLL